MHGFGVSPASYAAVNGSTIARLKSSRRSSVTCGSPRPWQVARAAATAAGEQQARSLSRRLRVLPEPQRHADGHGPGPEQGDRAVDAAAHRHRDAPRLGRRPEDLTECGGERLDCERLAVHRRRFEQRQPADVTVEPGRVGGDDSLAVDREARGGPLAAACRVSEDLGRHEPRLLTVSADGSRRSGHAPPELRGGGTDDLGDQRLLRGRASGSGADRKAHASAAGRTTAAISGREAAGFRDLPRDRNRH